MVDTSLLPLVNDNVNGNLFIKVDKLIRRGTQGERKRGGKGQLFFWLMRFFINSINVYVGTP